MGFITDLFGSKNKTNAQGFDITQSPTYNSALQTTQNQNALSNMLFNQLSGNGPSVAGQQMQQGLAQANNLLAGNLSQARGLSPALAARLSTQGAAQNAQNIIGQQGIAKAQEQLNAGSNLASNLAGEQSGNIGLINSQVQNSLGAQGINAQAAQQNAGFGQGLLGGTIGGIGAGLSKLTGFADGGEVEEPAHQSKTSAFMKALQSSMSAPYQNPVIQAQQAGMAGGAGIGNFLGGGLNKAFAPGPKLPGSMAIAGSPEAGMDIMGGVPQAAPQMMGYQPSLMDSGGQVPGVAEREGDSLENDKVPTMLSPGEVVVPRSKVQEGPEAAKDFVEAVKKKHSGVGFGHVIAAHRQMHERLQNLERLCYGGMN